MITIWSVLLMAMIETAIGMFALSVIFIEKILIFSANANTPSVYLVLKFSPAKYFS